MCLQLEVVKNVAITSEIWLSPGVVSFELKVTAKFCMRRLCEIPAESEYKISCDFFAPFFIISLDPSWCTLCLHKYPSGTMYNFGNFGKKKRSLSDTMLLDEILFRHSCGKGFLIQYICQRCRWLPDLQSKWFWKFIPWWFKRHFFSGIFRKKGLNQVSITSQNTRTHAVL